MMKKKEGPQVLFVDLKDEQQPTIVQSECMVCAQKGKTTILLLKIPFFREVMVVSFECSQCGQKNNEVQFTGKLPDFGIRILFRILSKEDLNRQVIRSEHAKIYFQQLDYELPMFRPQITTVESLLLRSYEELKFNQIQRKVSDPEKFQKIQLFLQKLKEYINGQKFPLTLQISDPSGNSYVKNPFAPKLDKNLNINNVPRTVQQLTAMGYSIENAQQQLRIVEQKIAGHKMNFSGPFEESNLLNQEAVVFDVPCHSCMMPGQMKTCQTNVPYFTDLVILSFSCEYCGAHSTETKNSGQIKQDACEITLQYEQEKDLKRDLFKSDTCKVQIPEIQLQLDYGTLGGVFTTVQGLIEKIYDHLDQHNPFIDSDKQFADRMSVLLQDLLDMRDGKKKFTLRMIDPLAQSFIQNPYHPSQDKRVKRQFRKRTEDQSDMLGITDMKTENYE